MFMRLLWGLKAVGGLRGHIRLLEGSREATLCMRDSSDTERFLCTRPFPIFGLMDRWDGGLSCKSTEQKLLYQLEHYAHIWYHLRWRMCSEIGACDLFTKK